jgi:glycerol-3-phosphate dehydrogenase
VCNRWWQLPYYYAGIKCYDLVAGSQLLKSSYHLSKSKALELFPMLKRDKLVGALVYYDGNFMLNSSSYSFLDGFVRLNVDKVTEASDM